LNIVLTAIPQVPITLRTTQPVSLEDVRELIYNLARANGISIAESGGFLRLHGSPQDLPQGDLRELYIYRLKHARAAVLASTLQALFSGTSTASGAQTGAGQTLSQRLQVLGQQAATLGAQQGGAQQAQTEPRAIMVLGPGSGELQAPVHIVPDEVTNSLLIRATPADWLVVEQALAQLDLRPLQVVIEVIIAEVTRSNELNFGIDWFVQDPDPRPGELTEGGFEREAPEGGLRLRLLRTGTVDLDATLHA